MGDMTDSVSPPPSRSLPVREDCWSEEATATLIDAWGRRYVELNRGNLRQKDWQEVANAVNALHGHTKKTHRTDVQCKNRIDTIKKKYKVEKSRVLSSNGSYNSNWVFYDRLDDLIGNNVNLKKQSPLNDSVTGNNSSSRRQSPYSPPVALPLPYKKSQTPATATVVALPQKRPLAAVDDGYFRRNYSAMAAAAAAAEVDDDEEDEEEQEEEELEGRESEEREDEGDGMRRLARAIEKFGQVYVRVEEEKLRQMVELEKQRMQFAKDLEVQRMEMFMETQVQLERVKRGKRSSSDGM